MLNWLGPNINDLSRLAGNHVFKITPEMENLSQLEKEDFVWEIEKYLERVYGSILTESTDLLYDIPILPSQSSNAYKDAFLYIKSVIPKSLDPNAIQIIGDNLDRLYGDLFS